MDNTSTQHHQHSFLHDDMVEYPHSNSQVLLSETESGTDKRDTCTSSNVDRSDNDRGSELTSLSQQLEPSSGDEDNEEKL